MIRPYYATIIRDAILAARADLDLAISDGIDVEQHAWFPRQSDTKLWQRAYRRTRLWHGPFTPEVKR